MSSSSYDIPTNGTTVNGTCLSTVIRSVILQEFGGNADQGPPNRVVSADYMLPAA